MTTDRSREPRVAAFADRVLGVINDAFLGLMISIGHRTRLFETLATHGPVSSDELARAARLDERYVREWLGAMVTGKLVDYDGSRKQFRLPSEHAVPLVLAGFEQVPDAELQVPAL